MTGYITLPIIGMRSKGDSFMKYRIVSDSSSNYLIPEGTMDYKTVPLKMLIEGKEYSDEIGMNVEEMVLAMERSQNATFTSCPNTQEWLNAFEGAEGIFAITISSQLSGSYNSAIQAGEIFMQEHPGTKVHVLDSAQTGAGMQLVIEKLQELIQRDLSFDEIRILIHDYMKHVQLIFTLESLANLAKNGRVNPAIAKVAGLLGIHFLGKAVDGKIQQQKICRGQKHVISAATAEMIKEGWTGGKVIINHCLNYPRAEKLKAALLAEHPEADVRITACTGLCSYYAERGGMIIGFEH